MRAVLMPCVLAALQALMGRLGFAVEQLMELAGLSCACALADVYGPDSHPRVLVICGPGNNGGDGLVAARHLHHFGYAVSVAYPKPTPKPLYEGLVTQARALGLPFLPAEDLLSAPLASRFDVVMDAMFGFSFHGAPRPPFDGILAALLPTAQPPALVSVDIPSGWQVEEGDVGGGGLRPDVLVSLTAPKMCARGFTGSHHYLGGRFVPPEIREQYNLRLPAYPGTAQCVRVGGAGGPPPGVPRPAAPAAAAPCRSGMQQLAAWLGDAAKGTHGTGSMTLALVGPDGTPCAAVAPLGGVSEEGVVFFASDGSIEGRQLAASPAAAACFLWEAVQRSARLEGAAERLSPAQADAAWAEAACNRSGDGAVARPPQLAAYRLRPSSAEFWQGQPGRAQSWLRYSREAGGSWALEQRTP